MTERFVVVMGLATLWQLLVAQTTGTAAPDWAERYGFALGEALGAALLAALPAGILLRATLDRERAWRVWATSLALLLVILGVGDLRMAHDRRERAAVTHQP